MKAQQQRSRGLRFGFRELTALVASSILLGYTFPFWEFPAINIADVNHASPPPPPAELMLRSSSQTKISMVTNTRTTTTTLSSLSSISSITPPDDDGLKVAWLMSYPNSGTSYTIHMVRRLSLTTTGTNYGAESLGLVYNKSVAVFEDQPEGPFFTDPGVLLNLTMPTRYILTKTHCGGRCVRCGPSEYMETTYSFRNRCLSGNSAVKFPDGTNEWHPTTYEPSRLHKAIHLIRNPFDNVVSRFHLERKQHGGKMGEMFTKDRTGFRSFCEYLNKEYQQEESRSVFLENKLDELTAGIPCRSEFFRFVEWHNLAMVTMNDLDLEIYTLYYDWYSTRFETTVDELLAFLEHPKRGHAFPFEDGKVYNEFFTEDERVRMVSAMKFMASPPLWKHIEHFFV